MALGAHTSDNMCQSQRGSGVQLMYLRYLFHLAKPKFLGGVRVVFRVPSVGVVSVR